VVALAAASARVPAPLGVGLGSSGAPLPEPSVEPCALRLERARQLPSEGPADFAPAERAALLLQVKATPIVFMKRPRHAPTDPVASQWRERLEQSELPGRVLAKLLARFRQFPAFLRDVLLSDGYLYAENAPLGVTLAEAVTPGALFRERRLVIERGARKIVAESDDLGGYRYVDGPEPGKPARLLLFDRVYVEGHEPSPPSHLDVAALRERLAFDRVELERVTAEGVLATALYEERRVPMLLARAGSALELACEAPGAAAADVSRLRALGLRKNRALARLREAILASVDENLPFDEPRTEFGQEDGKLRQRWREAYFRKQTRYDFNGDSYAVFDASGRPFVPQVCIDFVLDTLERAGGGWYAPEASPPGRAPGRIDFDVTGMLNRRNVEEFIALAERRPDWFELRQTPPEERIALERRERFITSLFEHRAEYRPGDIVVILGPRADEKLHYHSFFVFDADPVTGMPSLVAGNSGRPRVRAWTAEMAPAPKRSVFARVRPLGSLLEQTLDGSAAGGPRLLTAEAEPLRSPATP
jgi:hypothetical protein